jgi:conjugative transfer signal peptidase TraF
MRLHEVLRVPPRELFTKRLGRILWGTTSSALAASAVCLCVHRAGLAWNHTESLPMGLYASRPLTRDPLRGEIVSLEVPMTVRPLVEVRRYLHPGDLLFKRVVATPGDRVCLEGARYVVNGAVIGPTLSADSEHRPLPRYSYCNVVPPGVFWVGTTFPRSFDSRYFGPVTRADLVALLEPRWTF